MEIHSINNIFNAEGFEPFHCDKFFEEIFDYFVVFLAKKLDWKDFLENAFNESVDVPLITVHIIEGCEMSGKVEVLIFLEVKVFDQMLNFLIIGEIYWTILSKLLLHIY